MIKKDKLKNTKKGDNVIGFWYTLKYLDLLEEILKDISTQVLETKYILNLSQLL
jgi:hypothetical protein